MAQGAIKSKKPSSSSSTAGGRRAKPQPPKTKKCARVAKAKKGSAADKMQRKFAAGLVAKTEKLLGERAGHLELIGKGRVKGGDKAGEKSVKGGTRKFGQKLRFGAGAHAAVSWTLLSRYWKTLVVQ
ncbi:hypothetical protein GGR54DRAFT_638008 [Hypoxylon sp. NC1633]|nr:hypothetical protein GGR54DRAFT_638008 [Hypoxylon sp. NC1633]